MAIEVRRKQNESSESLVRRFSRRVLQSGIVVRTKKARFHEPKKNKRAIKNAALRRKFLVEKKEYFQKVGKLPPDEQMVSRSGRRTNLKLPIRIPKFKK